MKGFLLEGRLLNIDGTWFLKVSDDKGCVRLNDVLDTYKNQEVRITCVSLKELDELTQMMVPTNKGEDNE